MRRKILALTALLAVGLGGVVAYAGSGAVSTAGNKQTYSNEIMVFDGPAGVKGDLNFMLDPTHNWIKINGYNNSDGGIDLGPNGAIRFGDGTTMSTAPDGGGGGTTYVGIVPIDITDGGISCLPAGTGDGGCLTAGTQNVSGAKTFLDTGTFSSGLISSSTAEGSLLVGTATATSGWLATLHNTGSSHRGLFIDVQTNERALAINTNTGFFLDGATGAVQMKYDGSGNITFSHSIFTNGGLFSGGTYGPGYTDNSVSFAGNQYPPAAPGGGIGVVATGVAKYLIDSEAFTAAALTQDINPLTLPARSRILYIICDTTAHYTGTGLTGTIQMQVGTTSGGQELILAHDVKTSAVTKGLLAGDMGTSVQMSGNVQLGTVPSWASGTQIWIRVTSGAGNLGNGSTTNFLTGDTTLYVVYQNMP